MALARARELTDSVMAAINNGTDPDSHVQIFPYSGSHSWFPWYIINRTVGIISSNPELELNVNFTTVPFKPLPSNNKEDIKVCLSGKILSLLSKSVSHLRVNTSEKKYFFLEKKLWYLHYPFILTYK